MQNLVFPRLTVIANQPKEITLTLYHHGILAEKYVYGGGDFLFQLYNEQNSQNDSIEINGEKYIGNTYSEIQQRYQLPHSIHSIKRGIVRPLEKAGLLISCKPNKMQFYQRKAYRVNEEALKQLISQWREREMTETD